MSYGHGNWGASTGWSRRGTERSGGHSFKDSDPERDAQERRGRVPKSPDQQSRHNGAPPPLCGTHPGSCGGTWDKK